MAGAHVSVQYRDREVRRALARVAKLGGRPQAVLKDIGEYLLRSTRDRAEAQRDPWGRPWKPLSRPQVIRRVGGGRDLARKGTLRKPAQRRADRLKILIADRQAGLIATLRYQLEGGGLRLGTDKVYGAIHQLGGVIRPVRARALAIPQPGGGVRLVKRVTIPARPYLGISPADRRELPRIAADHVRRAMRR